MEHVVLVIHLILALAIIALVLLQRSEGGGLGIGNSGGLGGLATAGQTANAMTKATAFCAACFFATSLILGILAGTHSSSGSLLDKLDNAPAPIIINEEGGVTDSNMDAMAPSEQPAAETDENTAAPEVPAAPEERPSVPVE